MPPPTGFAVSVGLIRFGVSVGLAGFAVSVGDATAAGTDALAGGTSGMDVLVAAGIAPHAAITQTGRARRNAPTQRMPLPISDRPFPITVTVRIPQALAGENMSRDPDGGDSHRMRRR